MKKYKIDENGYERGEIKNITEVRNDLIYHELALGFPSK